MRELHYGSDVVIVSGDVCDAVFDYTVALANAGRTDRVTVPVLSDGARGYSNLLLGPATQLHCTAAAESADGVDLDDIDLVANLMAKTQRLTDTPSILAATVPAGPRLDDFDLD